MADEYTKRSYKRFEEEDDDDDYGGAPGNDAGYHRNDSRAANDEDEDAAGHSDSTEGHDEDDEIYEGEYQGIPRADSGGKPGGADGLGAGQAPFRDLSAYEAERRKDQEELAQQYETILQECGHGKFQWTLYFVLGLALMADGVEIFVVGFVLPSAEKDMCLSEPNKGMLGLIVYLGMMVGAFVWGGMADRIGRRQTLLISLSINSVAAFFSSFVQGYSSFLFCRLASGVGIGGSIPIVFSYYSEFLAQEKRGEHLSWLCMFWMIGGIYASAMAWAIIPHYGWSFQMGSAYQFHSWRVFVLVCALPSVAAICALTTMPESPRFFLENGKHDEAWMILKQVHDTNMRAKGYPERVFSVNINLLSVFVHLYMCVRGCVDACVYVCLCLCVCLHACLPQVRGNFLAIFSPEYRRTTYMMMAVWFSMSFSYYGLTVWFPDMIKYLQKQEYSSRTKTFTQERMEHVTFNFTLENQVHKKGQYFNDKFMNLKMKSMVFEDSLFEECYFEDITSSNTFFKNCTFIATLFYNTDLFKYRLINSRLINSTFLHNKEGCLLSDVSDDNNAYMVYFVSFLGTLAVLPGNIVSALLMDKIGRLRMLGKMPGGCFFLSFGNSESAMIALLCLFGGISIASWNALDVLTVELYPSDKRCTAFGFLNALCKLAAVLGISIFTSFVGITKAVPILFASGALAAGSFLALKLPETRGQVLQ
uniref:Major facilitator superfamily (MFS) profile domain-containing protein n=1 Tax=Gadus morhua TaxID=8049 RepID=A0A8C5C8J4_GADMO